MSSVLKIVLMIVILTVLSEKSQRILNMSLVDVLLFSNVTRIIPMAYQLIINFTLVEKMLSTKKKLVVSLRPVTSSSGALTNRTIKSPISNWFMAEDSEIYTENSNEMQYELLE